MDTTIFHRFVKPSDPFQLPPHIAIIFARLSHSTRVAYVDHDATYDADALVTDIPGFALCMKTADCVPVVFVDCKFGIIGIAHDGWRGIIGNINSKVVDLMIERGAKQQSIKAYIGPAIRACCYKVYGDRRRVFEEMFSEHVDRILVKQQDQSVCLDLVACVKIQLQKLGLLPENITDACECTKCTPGLPSYQRTPILKHKITSVAYISPPKGGALILN